MDNYFRKQARQDVKRRVTRVFVGTARETADGSDLEAVLGFFTLSALSLEVEQLPSSLARKLPKHPIPAALLGRLAVSKDVQGGGVGTLLLANAINRTLAVSDQIAVYALVVDAIDTAAQRYYESFGFSLLSADSRRLYLPLKSIS